MFYFSTPIPPTSYPAPNGSAMCLCIGRCGDLRNFVNPDSVKAGYEVSFTRYFCKF